MQDVKSKLKPCPFCGAVDSLKFSLPINDLREGDLLLNSWNVICTRCCSSGPFSEDEAECVKKWNFRSENNPVDWKELLQHLEESYAD